VTETTESANKMTLTCSCAGSGRWLPIKVETLSNFLGVMIPLKDRMYHGNVINKNVAYALQYCQYLSKTLIETLPTSVITAEHIKSYIVHGAGVVEAVLEYQLRAKYGYSKKQLRASDIAKEWLKASGVPIEQLLAQFTSVLQARNRIHLAKHEDDPQSMWRDTTYNFFLDLGSDPTTELLQALLSSELFAAAPHRDRVLEAFGIRYES